MSSSKNLEYRKTSFLNKSNSAFIERMYLKFINKDSDLPESWKNYFLDSEDEIDLVVKEINGPSWSPQKKRIDFGKGLPLRGPRRPAGDQRGSHRLEKTCFRIKIREWLVLPPALHGARGPV